MKTSYIKIALLPQVFVHYDENNIFHNLSIVWWRNLAKKLENDTNADNLTPTFYTSIERTIYVPRKCHKIKKYCQEFVNAIQNIGTASKIKVLT